MHSVQLGALSAPDIELKLKKRNRFVLCLEHSDTQNKYASFGAKCEVCATTLLRSTLLAAKKKKIVSYQVRTGDLMRVKHT